MFIKKLLCDHEWHCIESERFIESFDFSYAPTFKTVCTVFCPKCRKESKMSDSKYQKHLKKREILDNCKK